MKELLEKIQGQMRSDLSYIRPKNIYITPHVNFIPANVRPPCIGIKDGAITRTELPGEMWEVTMHVTLAVYVQLRKDEASIMGDQATANKGVLEIAEDIHESLDENLVGISGMQSAFSPSETESEMFGDETDALQRKLITYEYVKEEERP
jgi:hypothetical protein